MKKLDGYIFVRNEVVYESVSFGFVLLLPLTIQPKLVIMRQGLLFTSTFSLVIIS